MCPPILPVALALPTVLRSFSVAGLSKYPGPWEVGVTALMGDWPPARAVATLSRPARREIRSARSASRVVVDVDDAEEDWWVCRPCGKGAPWWPSFMAVVERALSPEFGVPLLFQARNYSGQVS